MRNIYLKETTLLLISCVVAFSFVGCKKKSKYPKPQINIEQYQAVEYETEKAEKGDLQPIIKLSLTPDEQESKDYVTTLGQPEVEKVYVSKGDYVDLGQVMVSFKNEDLQAEIDTYTNQKEEDGLLIEHYTNLMKIDSSQDYKEDIKDLKEDMELCSLYMKELGERLSDYRITAEKAGVVTYLYEYINEGYVDPSSKVVTVQSSSKNYSVVTTDDYPFKEGTEYVAKSGVASYKVRLKSITKDINDATGKTERKLVFEPIDDMSAVAAGDTPLITIEGDTVKNVVYVNSNAIKDVDDKQYVYIINSQGNREIKQVESGQTVDKYTVIKGGLDGGEQVVIQ